MSKHNGDCHSPEIKPEQLTAFALGQVRGDELSSVKVTVGETGHSTAGDEVREVQSLAAAIKSAHATEPLPKPSVELRAAVEARLAERADAS